MDQELYMKAQKERYYGINHKYCISCLSALIHCGPECDGEHRCDIICLNCKVFICTVCAKYSNVEYNSKRIAVRCPCCD